MNYRTTCPHCTSIFRLHADQLDAAQGWVQCGVCGNAFDARPSLLMEDGSPLPAASAPTENVEPTPAGIISPGAAQPAETTAPAENTPQTSGPPVGIVQRETSLDLTSIIIIDPDIPVPDDFGPMPQIHAAPASGPSAMPLMYPPPYSHEPAAVSAPVTRVEYNPPEYASPEPANSYIPPAPRHSGSWAWGSAGVLLAVLLVAQSAYFLRDTLVSQLPQTRPLLERMCALLGCTLSLPKNLALLRIVGSDLETEASGRLKLTLTLGNRAGQAQAWPVLVLSLTDQRNRPLARRSFAPSEYLGDAHRIAEGIPPLSEQPLSLPLAVHDLAPMGFDLQLSY